MLDVVNEALKLDPHNLLDHSGRPSDNFTIDSFEKIEVLNIKTVSVSLMNVIIKTGAYPFLITFKDGDRSVKGMFFIEGNTLDELLEITNALDNGEKPNVHWKGYILPENKGLTGKLRGYHGKFYRNN